MASPEDRAKRRARRQNHYAKDLRTPKFKEQTVPDKKRVRVRDLTHNQLIRLIQEEDGIE